MATDTSLSDPTEGEGVPNIFETQQGEEFFDLRETA